MSVYGDTRTNCLWAPVFVASKITPGPYARYQYHLPGSKQLSAVIGADVERDNVNAPSPLKLETTSFVYHVVEGKVC